MNRVLKYLFIILLTGVFFSCATAPEKQDIYYLVKVDSLTHPQSVSLNDTIAFRLYGVVGTDGCHSFSHFEALVSPADLELKVWGKMPVNANACPAVMVYLEGKEYKIAAKERGTLRVRVTEPDGSVLKDSVKVL